MEKYLTVRNMIDINKIDKVFKDIGYLKKQLSNGDVQYFKNDIFCKFEYVSGLDSYILSSSLGNEEAKQNIFEDDEVYSNLTSDNEILDKLKSDIANLIND